MKKIHRWFVALLVSAVVGFAPTHVGAQGTISVYFAAGPTSGAPDYNTFLSSMVNAMEQGPSLSLAPSFPFITPGSTISATNSFVRSDHSGSQIHVGVVFTDPAGFNSSQLSYSFLSSIIKSLGSASYGVGAKGINWGADGQPGTADDIVYTSGSASTRQVNSIAAVVNGYSFFLNNGETINDGINAFRSVFPSDLKVGGTYYLNGTSCSSDITLTVPEPSALGLTALGCLGIMRLKRPRSV